MRIFEKYPPSIVVFAAVALTLTLYGGLASGLLVVAVFHAAQWLDTYGIR